MNIPTGDDHNDAMCRENHPGGPQEPVELPLCPFCGKEPIIDGTWAYCDNHSGQVELEIEEWRQRYEPSPSRSELLAEIAALRADKERLDLLQYLKDECEGRILTRLFMPNERTLRESIDSAYPKEAKCP